LEVAGFFEADAFLEGRLMIFSNYSTTLNEAPSGHMNTLMCHTGIMLWRYKAHSCPWKSAVLEIR
jgi:hypothetical protein